MANKITTFVEVVTDVAKSNLGSLKQAISDADTAGGKLKAGFGVVKDSVVANAGALSLGAGAALVGFGIKAVGAFEDTATAAIHLSDTVGVNIEDASRWIGVADDYGISADTLQSSLGKVSKTLDDTKWAQFGVATRDAGGQVRPVNDILLDTFDKLSAMTNAGDRAREGAKLFGKGYAAIAPMIGHTRAEYEKMLGAVEGGQVITDGEAKKSEAMRLAQDHLHDALQEVTLAVGGLVAQGAPIIDFFANVVEGAVNAKGALDGLKFGDQPVFGDVSDSLGVFGKITDAFGNMRDRVKEVVKYGPFSTTEQQKAQDMQEAIKNVSTELDGGEKSWEEYAGGSQAAVAETERETRALGRATGDLTDPIELAKRASKMMTDSIEQGLNSDKAALDALKGTVDDHAAWTNLELEFDSVKQAGVDAADAVKNHTDDARTKTLEYAASLDGLKSHVIDYATEVLKLPTEQVTKIVAAVDPQSISEAEALLAALTRNRNISLSIIAKGGAGYEGGLTGARAAGGPVSAGGDYLVGEDGPEVVHMNGNGNVSTARRTAKMLGHTFNINVGNSNASPDDIARSITWHWRVAG